MHNLSILSCIYDLCIKIDESNDYTYETARNLKMQYQKDIIHFLIYLSNKDGQLSEYEIDFINEIIGNKLLAYDENHITSLYDELEKRDFSNTIPKSLEYFLKTKNMSGTFYNGKYYNIIAIYIYSFESIGREFIACNNIVSKEEVASLTKYELLLHNYIVTATNENVNFEEESSLQKDKDIDENYSNNSAPADDFDISINQLSRINGLTKPKEQLIGYINLLKVNKIRQAKGLKTKEAPRYFAFIGNPGTGKSLLASRMARICKSASWLSKGHITEIDRSDLIGSNLNDSISKINKIIDKAKGGVLFIDDIYTVMSSANDSLMLNVLDALLNLTDEVSNDLITIISGPKDKMEDFFNSNQLYDGHFSTRFIFNDYTADEMKRILYDIARESDYSFQSEAEFYVNKLIDETFEDQQSLSQNANIITRFLDTVYTKQADRITKLEDTDALSLTSIALDDVIDIPFE